MIALFDQLAAPLLTVKILVPFGIYCLKYAIEGAVVKFDSPKKLGVDLCYMAIILNAINLMDNRSGLCAAAKASVLEEKLFLFLSIVGLCIMWVMSIFLFKRLDAIKETSFALSKKGLYFTATCVIGLVLLVIAGKNQ